MTWLPRDKTLHVLAGALLFAAGYLLAGTRAGLLLCICGGAMKEMWDGLTGKGQAEMADFFATCGGGVLAALILHGMAYGLPSIPG